MNPINRIKHLTKNKFVRVCLAILATFLAFILMGSFVFLFIHFKILVYVLILLLMFSTIVFLVYNMLFKF